jgi:hypothetical protein
MRRTAAAPAGCAGLSTRRPALGKFAHRYAVQLVFLLMHVPAFVGIRTFRRYILAR